MPQGFLRRRKWLYQLQLTAVVILTTKVSVVMYLRVGLSLVKHCHYHQVMKPDQQGNPLTLYTYVSKEKLRSIPLLEKKFHDDVTLIRRQLADHYAVLFDLKPEFFVRLHLAKLLSDTAFDYISLPIHTVQERSCLLSDYLHRLDAEQAIQLMNIVSSYILRSGVVTLYEGVFSRIGLDPRKKIPPQPVYACCCCSDN